MTSESKTDLREQQEKHMIASSDTVYGIGMIGAWVYYFKNITTFKEGVIAFFKGFAWPAILVYELFTFLRKE